jgi:hypothetical protein
MAAINNCRRVLTVYKSHAIVYKRLLRLKNIYPTPMTPSLLVRKRSLCSGVDACKLIGVHDYQSSIGVGAPALNDELMNIIKCSYKI